MELLSDREESNRKVLAFIVCLFLGFVYFETIVRPYVSGGKPGEARQVTGSTTDPGLRGDRNTSATPALPPAEVFNEAEPVAGVPKQGSTPAEASGQMFGSGRNTRYPSDAEISAAGTVIVSNQQLTVRFSLLGGRITQVLLHQYRSSVLANSAAHDLISHIEGAPYPLGVYTGAINDSWTRYALGATTLRAKSAEEFLTEDRAGTLVLQGVLSDGRAITKTISLDPSGYLLGVTVALGSAAPDASALAVEWTKLVGKSETSLLDPYNAQGFTWLSNDKTSRQNFHDFPLNGLELGSVGWITLGDKYFMSGFVMPDKAMPATAMQSGQLFRARVLGEASQSAFSIYLGPKSYRILERSGFALERNIDFGKTGFIAAPLLSLLHLFYAFLGNYGLAIVALTIVVRLALYPLNAASYKSMKAMQDIKPDVDRIREQIKDKQQQQVELMALYKKRGVNPLGGCLPVLLQMPVFIGLYSALMLAVELRHAPFAMWIHDLSVAERLSFGPFGLPVLVILYVLTMMVQQWITPSAMDPVQKRVMMVMPVVFGFMLANLPAGLTLYMLTTMLASIGQQQAMTRFEGSQKSALLVTVGVSLAVLLFACVVALF